MASRNVVQDKRPIGDNGEDPLHLDEVEKIILSEKSGQKRLPVKIVWRNVILFTILHLAAVCSIIFIPRSHPFTWLWAMFYYVFSALGITAGAHRLWSHRTYKAKTPLRILLAMMQSAAFQNDILEWARDHRTHHKYSETDADPHNAKRGFFFSHIGWLLVKKHPDVISKGKALDISDLYADKIVVIQRKIYKSSVLLMCVIVPTFVPCYLWKESIWNAFFLAVVLRYTLVLNATWLVNSAAHMWGTKPYDKRINPSQNRVVSFSAIGEGFHNYHHVFPQDYATSEYGWHLNISTLFIDAMARLGLATDRRTVSDSIIKMRKERTGDGST